MSAREPWRAVEALHDVVYFAPDARERFEAVGLRGFWMGYTASRSAALGTPSADVVTAVFHGFAPSLVGRAVPDAWALADREAVLRARLDLAVDRLATVLDAAEPDLAVVVDRLVEVARGADCAGAVLAAAHRSLPEPEGVLARLWWAATVLRELRGDLHVAVLSAHGVDGAMANRWALALGLVPERQRDVRGWSPEEWDAAADRLEARGWLRGGEVVEEGRAARERLEQLTDNACAHALRAVALPADLRDALTDLARRVAAGGLVGYPNPTGVPAP